MRPVQDTPGVKSTYSASVTVDAELTALMSALDLGASEPQDGRKCYRFKQSVAVPSYLIAIVVANLEGRPVGPRSTVWSEPEMVGAAADEFRCHTISASAVCVS